MSALILCLKTKQNPKTKKSPALMSNLAIMNQCAHMREKQMQLGNRFRCQVSPSVVINIRKLKNALKMHEHYLGL